MCWCSGFSLKPSHSETTVSESDDKRLPIVIEARDFHELGPHEPWRPQEQSPDQFQLGD